MKTTVEIPDSLFRKVKSQAAERGQTLKEFLAEALEEKLTMAGEPHPAQPRWMAGFGKLRQLRKETTRIQKRIDATFDVIEPEDRM